MNVDFKRCQGISPVAIQFSTKQNIIFQHADDTVTASDKESIYTFELFYKYGKASRANINRSKTEFMGLEDTKIEEIDEGWQPFSICKKVIQIVGVYVGKK